MFVIFRRTGNKLKYFLGVIDENLRGNKKGMINFLYARKKKRNKKWVISFVFVFVCGKPTWIGGTCSKPGKKVN